MSVDAGAIVAEARLDVSQFDAAAARLPQTVNQINTSFEKIKAPALQLPLGPLKDDSDKAVTLATQVADAISHLSGGRITLDIEQFERAGADATKILGTITAGLADTAAATAAFSVVVVAALVAVEHELVEMGEHWEAAFRQISVSTGKTGEDLERFEASALKVGLSTGKAPEALTEAMAELSVRLGLSDAALEQATTSVLKFAAVTKQDAATAAVELSKAMTAFHEPASAAADDLNVLLRVSQQTRIPIAQLEAQMHGQLAPTLQALGFDFASTAVLIGKMSQQTDGGRAAMLGFNKILEEAAAAGKNPREVFAQIVEELKATGDVSSVVGGKLAQDLGARGFALLSNLAKNGALDVKDASTAIRTSGDTVDEAFGRMRSGAEEIGRQLGILKAQFAPIGIEIAKFVNALENQVAGGIGNITASIKQLQQARADFVASLPPQVVEAVAALPTTIATAGAKALLAPPGATPTAAEAHPPAGEGGIGGVAEGAAAGARTLATQITQLQKQLDGAAADKDYIQTLLETKQTLEETQKALDALPPAISAEGRAALAAAADEKAAAKLRTDGLQAVAEEAASQKGVLEDVAAADEGNVEVQRQAALGALQQRDALRELMAARSPNVALTLAEMAATDALRLVQEADATAERSRAAAVAAGATADEAAATAAQARSDALAAGKPNYDAIIDAAARYSVQQERTNAILSASKPFLDADQEATIKAAVAKGNLTEALTAAGQAMGLTDADMGQLRNSLVGSQRDFDATVNAVKALQIPNDELNKSLGALASAAYPNLTRAEADHLRQVVAVGDADATAAELARLYGVSVAELRAHLDDTGAHFDTYVKQQAAANRALADFVSAEQESRISSTLGALASGVDASTAALAKQLQESGHTADALTLLARQYGVSAEQAALWAEAVKQGGGTAQLAGVQIQLATAITGDMGKAIFEAKEQLSALTSFARDPHAGTIRLKVDIDIGAAEKALGDLQQQFREANAKRADVETKATRDFREQQNATAQQQSQLGADYAASVLAISQARQESSQQLGRDIQAATTTQNEAARKIDNTVDEAITKHALSIADAVAKYQEGIASATETFNKGMEGFTERARNILQQAADAAAGALRQVSGAMQAFNDQARSTANATSIAQEQAQLAASGFTDFQSQQSALRAAQIQAQGTAGLAQVAGANALNQTLQSSNQALQKATEKAADEMGKLSQEMQNLNTTFQKATEKAAVDADKAIRDANLALEKTNHDAQLQREADQRKADDTRAQAQEQDRRRQKELDDKAAAEQLRQQEELIRLGQERTTDPEGKGRTKVEQAFDEAEKARREEQRKADKAFEDQKKTIDEQLALLRAIRDGLQRPNVTANVNAVQETGRDMLQKAAQVAQQRLKV